MGLEELETGIRAKGASQMDEIKRTMREEKARVKAELESEAARKCLDLKSDCESKSEAARKSILSAARLEASSITSLEKASAVDMVFKAARERILALPDVKKRKLLSALLEDKKLLEGRPVVLAGKECARLLPKPDGFIVKTEDVSDFGFVITSGDGLVRVDKRLDAVLAELRETITGDLHKIIFAEGKT